MNRYLLSLAAFSMAAAPGLAAAGAAALGGGRADLRCTASQRGPAASRIVNCVTFFRFFFVILLFSSNFSGLWEQIRRTKYTRYADARIQVTTKWSDSSGEHEGPLQGITFLGRNMDGPTNLGRAAQMPRRVKSLIRARPCQSWRWGNLARHMRPGVCITYIRVCAYSNLSQVAASRMGGKSGGRGRGTLFNSRSWQL